MKIKLKDDIREFENGLSLKEIASAISEGLARASLCARVDGEIKEMNVKINGDCEVEFLTFKDEDGKKAYRHTTAHVLAQAVKRLYPDVKVAIGPAIKNGFYYDFDFKTPISASDLGKIEEEMKNVIKENHPVVREEITRAEALKLMADEPYKVELIENLPEDAVISIYRQGEFVDLCAGPHIPSTGLIKAYKLSSVTGAYWRGDEHNKMLTRIYGTAFDKKSDMDEYFAMIEEAKKRDHIKLGKELKLFAFLNEGKGFPFFLPNGMTLKNTLIDFWRQIHKREGYVEVQTPIILNRSLWETSGHWDHYQGNMYTTKIDDEDCAIKPMNCPGGLLVYKLSPHSYKDFPIRMGELGLVHRHEKSGQLHGLMRVRCFTQDDAHIFMLPEQITSEIKGVVRIIDEVYTLFGFKYHIELSTRPENSMGSDEDWEAATSALKAALDELNLPYEINEGDGAFYGPKIDFHLEDSLGRTWQCGTIQLDFQLPQRFEIDYVGEDGQKHRPIMIHRVVFGSIERFIGILIEHFGGKFPLWLSPIQVKVMSLTERTEEEVEKITAKLSDCGIRAESDVRNEKIGFKIREAQTEKTPYMLIIGDKEKENGVVAVRKRGQGDIGAMTLDEFIATVKKEIDEKSNG